MTSTCRDGEALPFQTAWGEERHFVKMGSPPESTPAKRQESKSLFLAADKVLRVASGPAKVRRFCEIRFRPHTIRVNHCRRKRLKSRGWKGGRDANLPCCPR